MIGSRVWWRKFLSELIEIGDLVPQETYDPIHWKKAGSFDNGLSRRVDDVPEKLRVEKCSECGACFVLNQFQHYKTCSLCWYSYQMERKIDAV